MKKMISLLLALALCAALLAGCGSPAPSGASSASAQSAASESEPQQAAQRTAFRIASLKGPTTMGLVGLMDSVDKGEARHDYEVTMYGAADEITPLLVKGEVDVALVPCNLASVLYNKMKETGGVEVAAINTLGVLYIVTTGDGITSVADLSGLKIRTQTNDVHVAYFDALGALPTPMSFNELYSALQQKTVDGQENPTAMIWNNNIWEVQPYMTVSEHVWTATTLCIGAEFFEGLPEDYQAAIQEAADNTTRLQREMITQENEELLQNIIDGGVEVVELTDEAKQEFIDIAQESVYPQAAQDYGQELIDLALSYNGAADTSGGDTGDADTSSASTPGSDVSASTSSSAA